MKKVLKREQLNVNHTWDLTRLFLTEELYEKSLNDCLEDSKKFKNKFEGKLNNEKTIIEALNEYTKIITNFGYVRSYQSLNISVDQTNESNIIRTGNFNIIASDININLTFFMSELKEVDDEILKQIIKLEPNYKVLIEKIIKDKKYKLDKNIEHTLSQFSQVFNAPYKNYEVFKLADMKFSSFKVNNKEYPNSFTLFENEWSHEINHDVRRAAFVSFYDKLKEYENGFASNYQTHVLTEKAFSNLKGFNSVTEYLLYEQDVTLDMYHRQIDLIMKHLSKPMQKFAKLIQKQHNLDKLTYADLQISLDPEFEPTVTIEESQKYMLESLSILGPEYTKMIKKAFDERWIDFPQNIGKSTGGFCSSPYRKGSYILLNWNNLMNENFVLAHELGHAGHFYFAGQNQHIFNMRPSMYFIEAPSTMNELIIANYLEKQSNDLRFKRWVLQTLIARTYYHNFVTHLLEAAFQRKVYERVDNKQPLSAKVLNELKLSVLKEFWGDAVEIPEYAGRTWMRQPHYFMGLYPYTYSAGLTIATATFEKIKKNQLSIDKWIEVLKQGGTKSPLELAKIVDLDLSTEQPLLETINSISKIIDEIEQLSNKI